MKLKKKIWSPKGIWKLSDILFENGFKLYLVGGCVRDTLTGDKPKDFDVATDAKPQDILSILGSKYRVDLQGEQFGVVVAYGDGLPKEGIEIATFREDLTSGRNPEVKIGVTIESDVKRRDLTINALFYDLVNEEIIDLVGGIQDLKMGIIRMVGNPIERIEEDRLRILRVFRFSSRYNFTIDPKTKAAIRKYNNLVDAGGKRVSQERIWQEFNKAYNSSKDFTIFLNLISEFDMWEEVFPGVGQVSNVKKSDSLVVMMAQLLVDSNVDMNKMLEWDFQKQFSKSILTLINFVSWNGDVYELMTNLKRTHITESEWKEWLKLNGNKDSKLENLLSWEPKTKAQDVIKDGYKGVGIKNELTKRINQEFYD